VGADLKTFIDKDFQEYFYDRLSTALKFLRRDIGTGIALNPKNGEVLALFNIPSFDSAEVDKYLNLANKPLFNRAISGLYTPGSTVKPLVAVGALVQGIISPFDKIFSPGFIDVPNPYNPARERVDRRMSVLGEQLWGNGEVVWIGQGRLDDVLYRREEATPETSVVYGLVEE
jgi:penicillin-binding protein 2